PLRPFLSSLHKHSYPQHRTRQTPPPRRPTHAFVKQNRSAPPSAKNSGCFCSAIYGEYPIGRFTFLCQKFCAASRSVPPHPAASSDSTLPAVRVRPTK